MSSLVECPQNWVAAKKLGGHILVTIHRHLFGLSLQEPVLAPLDLALQQPVVLPVHHFVLALLDSHHLQGGLFVAVFHVCGMKHLQLVLDGPRFELLAEGVPLGLLQLLLEAGLEVLAAHLLEPFVLDALVHRLIVPDHLLLVHEARVLVVQVVFVVPVLLVLEADLLHVALPEIVLLLLAFQDLHLVFFQLLLAVDQGHHVPHVDFGLGAEACDLELAIHLVEHREFAVDGLSHDPLGDLSGYGVTVDLDQLLG
jgi:hypothetical protein